MPPYPGVAFISGRFSTNPSTLYLEIWGKCPFLNIELVKGKISAKVVFHLTYIQSNYKTFKRGLSFSTEPPFDCSGVISSSQNNGVPIRNTTRSISILFQLPRGSATWSKSKLLLSFNYKPGTKSTVCPFGLSPPSRTIVSGREAGTQATWSVLGELIGNCEASTTYTFSYQLTSSTHIYIHRDR